MTNEELEKKCMDLYEYLANNFDTPFLAVQGLELTLHRIIFDHSNFDSDELFDSLLNEMKTRYQCLKKMRKDARNNEM